MRTPRYRKSKILKLEAGFCTCLFRVEANLVGSGSCSLYSLVSNQTCEYVPKHVDSGLRSESDPTGHPAMRNQRPQGESHYKRRWRTLLQKIKPLSYTTLKILEKEIKLRRALLWSAITSTREQQTHLFHTEYQTIHSTDSWSTEVHVWWCVGLRSPEWKTRLE